ncbi:hypothetical protein IMZ48_44945 [Candidatus Bathyarchaeota archaeon]|nr:hypothetical protein [Candidatus Bathyarchaeota archaeon]
MCSSACRDSCDGSESRWTWVDVADPEAGGGSGSDWSVVADPRRMVFLELPGGWIRVLLTNTASSPLDIGYGAPRPRLADPGVHIPWPVTLPWFQFQERYLDSMPSTPPLLG